VFPWKEFHIPNLLTTTVIGSYTVPDSITSREMWLPPSSERWLRLHISQSNSSPVLKKRCGSVVSPPALTGGEPAMAHGGFPSRLDALQVD